MTTIRVNPLNLKSINESINKLKKYEASVKSFAVFYTKAVAQKFNDYLSSEAPAMAQGLWMMRDVVIEGNHVKCAIVFNGEVEFVEFGTGYVGLENHQGINEEWLDKLPAPYNIGWNTGQSIVHVQVLEGDTAKQGSYDYWVYHDGNRWVRTSGIPADPFIYRAVQRIWDERAAIAKEVFGQLK